MANTTAVSTGKKTGAGIVIFILLLLAAGASAGRNLTAVYSERGMVSGDTSSPAPATPHHPLKKNTVIQEFSIQAGAFASQANADKLQQKLRAGGYRTDVYKNFLGGKKLFYLVWVGSYHSEEEAKPDLASLKSKFNISGVIRPRSILQH
ncbi:MAG TPA: SPOR domain-containing protein [Bacteroidota bacterium]|nr:SPOR domain-containing protein [Bacteroidota bacterium]